MKYLRKRNKPSDPSDPTRGKLGNDTVSPAVRLEIDLLSAYASNARNHYRNDPARRARVEKILLLNRYYAVLLGIPLYSFIEIIQLEGLASFFKNNEEMLAACVARDQRQADMSKQIFDIEKDMADSQEEFFVKDAENMVRGAIRNQMLKRIQDVEEQLGIKTA